MVIQRKHTKPIREKFEELKDIAETISSVTRGDKMSDVEKYISKRKKKDPEFAENFEEGYREFKIGVLLRQAREEAGLTQEQLADLIHTKKTAISRLENHAGDIKLSTLRRVAKALGKQLELSLI
jgi:HTH-type transcriptional regulator/antitoxin HipB